MFLIDTIKYCSRLYIMCKNSKAKLVWQVLPVCEQFSPFSTLQEWVWYQECTIVMKHRLVATISSCEFPWCIPSLEMKRSAYGPPKEMFLWGFGKGRPCFAGLILPPIPSFCPSMGWGTSCLVVWDRRGGGLALDLNGVNQFTSDSMVF